MSRVLSLPQAVMDYRLIQAMNEIRGNYNDVVDVISKAKSLNKFGTNTTVGTDYETVAQFQGAVGNETFVSTNLIDSVVSTSGSDTQTIRIEGHTIDGSGNLTFAAQDVTLTGTTEATLSTPLARCNRMFIKASGTFNSPQAAAVGTISAYDNTDGVASGVPNTAAATKCIIAPTFVQSEKCATSISATDYWLVTDVEVGIGDAGGSANRVTFRIEARDIVNGGVWRPFGRNIVVNIGQNGVAFRFEPLAIVPKNHDVRVVAKSNTSTAEVFAEIQGYLAQVIG